MKEAYEEHRDEPTVAVKRRLWQDLLQVALGKDAAAAGDESDWLFIRHTYITSLIAVIMQQQLLGDVARLAAERPDALLKGRILAQQSDLHGIIDADLFTWPTEVEGNHLPAGNRPRRRTVRLDAEPDRGGTHPFTRTSSRKRNARTSASITHPVGWRKKSPRP